MSLGRALGAPLRCQRCHHTTLNTFIGIAGLSLTPAANRTLTLTVANVPQRRVHNPDNLERLNRRSLGGIRRYGIQIGTERDASHSPEDGQDNVEPWYLQEQESFAAETTLLERQTLPDVPLDCPERVGEIVQYLADGLGMESISLLDLRKLDPPPALGSNLIMLVNTARSIRHLNVSAERLCRWLRTSYNLRAHADGLLGRRELKLKLRRRARRAKVLGDRGRPIDSDDGITTGWICVNIGSLEPRRRMHQVVKENSGDTTGFNQEEAGVHVVVQMLTEEKREAMQLEELWSSFLDRQSKREESRLQEDIELTSDATNKSWSFKGLGAQRSSQKRQTSQPSSNPSLRPHIQRRTLHTNSSHTSSSSSQKLSPDPEPHITEIKPQPRLHAQRTSSEHELWNLLEQLLTYGQDQAQAALGAGWQDRTSTKFLTSFHGKMNDSLTINEYRAWMALNQYAKQIQHDGYGIPGMINVIKHMQRHGKNVPGDMFERVVQHLPEPSTLLTNTPSNIIEAIRALEVLSKAMKGLQQQGMTMCSPSAICKLFHTIMVLKSADSLPPEKAMPPTITADLESLARRARLPIPHEDMYFMAINELVAAQHWDDLWKLWAGFPIRMEPRSPELYAAVLRAVAGTKHQRACLAALSRLVPTMEIEDPPVAIQGEVAEALLAALKVAEPDIENQIQISGSSNRHYVKLFELCQLEQHFKDRDWWEEEEYTL